MRRYLILLCVTMMCLAVLGGCREEQNVPETKAEITSAAEKVQDAPLLIKVATTKLPEGNAYEGLEMLKELIETNSAETIEVQLYPGGQLGESSTMLEGLKMGTVEIAFLPVGTAESIFPEVAVLGPLFSIDDEEQAIRICQSEQAGEIFERMREETHIRCVGFSVEGVRNIWSSRPLESMEDLEGLRLRLPEIPIFSYVFQTLGVSPVPMSMAQVYSGLQAGLLDGVELDTESVLRYHLYDNCMYCMETEHGITVYTFFIGDTVFQEMSAEQQAIIEDAANQVSQWMMNQYMEDKEGFREELLEKGVTFYEPSEGIQQEIKLRTEEAVFEYLEKYMSREALTALWSQ